jgi:hypothetical protein
VILPQFGAKERVVAENNHSGSTNPTHVPALTLEFMYLELAPKMLLQSSEVKGRGTNAHSKKMDHNHVNSILGG